MSEHLADVVELRNACCLPTEVFSAFKERIEQRLLSEQLSDKSLAAVSKALVALHRMRLDADKTLIQAELHGVRLTVTDESGQKTDPKHEDPIDFFDLIEACNCYADIERLEPVGYRLHAKNIERPTLAQTLEAAETTEEVELVLTLKGRVVAAAETSQRKLGAV